MFHCSASSTLISRFSILTPGCSVVTLRILRHGTGADTNTDTRVDSFAHLNKRGADENLIKYFSNGIDN